LQPTPDPNIPAQAPSQSKTFDQPSESNKPADGNQPTENNKSDGNNRPAPESRLLLPPQSEPAGSGSNRALRGLDPEDQDRFTAVPMRQVWAMRPVTTALKQPTVPVQMTPTRQTVPAKSTDSNPWRAARP
jgi:hypothetical protein